MFALKICRRYLYGAKSVIYTDHKILQHIFNQKEQNMRQRRWIELFSDYDCEIRYHPDKANVSIKDKIPATQKEASKESVGFQRGLDEMIESRSDGALYYLDRIWVPLKGDVRTLIMDEGNKSKYSVHPGADMMYYDIRDRYWWPGIKKDIAVYDYKIDRFYLNEIVVRYDVPILVIYDCDSRFTLRFWQSMQEALGTRLDMSTVYYPQIDDQSKRTIQNLKDMLRACVLNFRGSWDVHLPLVDFSYNESYHSSVRCASFETLYGRKCCKPIMWAEVGEGQLIGLELVKETSEKIMQFIELRLRMVRFKKKGKLAPRFVGPFETTERIGLVDYRRGLPEELNGVHDMFHVLNLKKYLADPTLESSRSLSGVEFPSSRFGGIRNVDLNLRGSVKIK
nr:retrotransposon protein, putative, Ty3-gypsy subclass [Tanacetum cinerariifolium]